MMIKNLLILSGRGKLSPQLKNRKKTTLLIFDLRNISLLRSILSSTKLMGDFSAMKRLFFSVLLFSFCLISPLSYSATPAQGTQALVEDWSGIRYRRWVGPNLWANRLADWEVRDEALMPACGDPSLPVRTVHVITRYPNTKLSIINLSYRLSAEVPVPPSCRIGFLVGAGAGLLDYKAAALVHCNSGRGGGLLALLELDGRSGRLTFRDNSDEQHARVYPELAAVPLAEPLDFSQGREYEIRLLVVPPASRGERILYLTIKDLQSGELVGELQLKGLQLYQADGSFAIAFSALEAVSSPALRIKDFKASGDLQYHPERKLGPVIGTLYSFNRGTLKMTAQFAPVACQDASGSRYPNPLIAYLEISNRDGSWQIADSARISQPGYVAHFRLENYRAEAARPYRVTFTGHDSVTTYYKGQISREPGPEETLILAAFTGMGQVGRTADSGPAPSGKGPVVGRWTPANVWFPFSPTVENLAGGQVDLLSFTGDQIYEGKPTSPNQSDRFPVLDYLYKWYLWHWAFAPLTRNTSTVCQVDDHDIYQGNVWGAGGKMNMTGYNYHGGYMRDPLFISLVQRTQTAHNPDPYDPAPIGNGILPYYCLFSYGGVGFALLEDRKYKSSRDSDEAGALLLGPGQLKMLDNWATDWHDVSMKVVLSQSLYASMHTGNDGRITADRDTGGWPVPGRQRAVRAFRAARALVLCGDQHLSTLARLGLESWTDGPIQFCVPAIGNIFWRWFYPDAQGSGPNADPEGYTGNFLDGFGNRFRMIAAANPTNIEFRGDRNQTLRRWNSRPSIHVDSVRLCQGDGMGIVRINPKARTYTIECWPYDVQPGSGSVGQFNGWPQTFLQKEIGGEYSHWIARVEPFQGHRLIAEVANQQTGELVYCAPVFPNGDILGVYGPGTYRLVLNDPEKPAGKREFGNLTAFNEAEKIPLIKCPTCSDEAH
jgi:alkaline phosphatase D